MPDLIIKKLNEAYLRVTCERHIAQELNEFFSFRVPGYQFMPAFRNKIWDGFLRLYSLRDNTLYHGLFSHLLRFCEERSYTYEADSEIIITNELSLVEAKEFIDTLNIPLEIRDYQLQSFVQTIRNRRSLILSPTGSGKTVTAYLIVRYLQSIGCKRGLVLTPSVSLVEQLYKDFKSYGYNAEENCHRLYSGMEKVHDKFLLVSTWQSVFRNPPEYFEQFDFIITDECHLAKAKSLTSILTSCINSKYRIGLTGSLDDSATHKLVLEGLFGPVYKATSTSDLIERKQLANFKIKCLILKYPPEVCKQSKNWTYQDELNFIVSNTNRNNFICNLVLSLNGNSLVLFRLVEKHGKQLFSMIQEKAKNRHVFFVYGGTDVEIRESVREITEKESNAIIVASYGVFAQGVNIRNLHNIIFASPSKSRIRNLQSIGRGLRIKDNGECATLFDIADDFRFNRHVNFTLQHFSERVKLYDSEKFPYKFYNIELSLNYD